MHIVFAIFLLFLFIFPAWAEEAIKLEEVMVTATRIESPVEDVPQDVTVITKQEIQSGSYRNITEIIRNVTGLNMFEYGSTGSSATLTIRGSTAEQVLVMVDGKRINKPGDGLVDFNSLSLPLEYIERIEILRGASSALYGAEAMGGVINIITQIPDEPCTNLAASYGRFATRDSRFSTSGKFGRLGYFLSLSEENSSGFRTNSEYTSDAVNAKLTFDIAKNIRADVTVDYTHKEAGAPGSLTWLTPFAEQTDETFNAGLTLAYKEILARLYSHNARIRYLNPGSEDNTHRNYVKGIDLQHSIALGSSNLLTGGVELLEEDIDSSDNINAAGSIGRRSRTRKGIFIQNESAVTEKLLFILGARYDDIGSHRRISPKASFLIKLPYQSSLSMSAGKGFRVPAMNALYWPDTGWAAGNPDLRPEQSTEYECSIRKAFDTTGNLRIVAFEKRSKDLIQWQETSPGIWSPENVSRARVRGFEADGEVRISIVRLGLNYTFMDPEDRMTGKKIRFGTRHQIKGTVSLHPAKGTTLSAEWMYISHYVVQPGDPRCYFLLNGKLSQKIPFSGGTAEIFITGKNILDRDFQTIVGYPMPPVQLFGGMSISF